MRRPVKLLLFVLGLDLLFGQSLIYADDFYSNLGQGWLNYNYSEPAKSQGSQTQAVKTPEETPSQKMTDFQTYFNNVKDEAVENPTDEAAVERYIALQSYIQNQSIRFTETWKKVLLDDPGFDYELIHPTNSIATKIDHNQTTDQEKLAVHDFAKQYGMMFFYYGQDQYAQAMAKSLQYFADQNGIALMGVSMDGKIISAITNNQTNNGQAQKMGVRYFPAIFLVDPKNSSYEALAYGMVSQDELLERFYDIATNFNGQNLLTGGQN